MITVSEELNEVIQKYGGKRDALNIILAKLQTLQCKLLGEGMCPDCFHGDMSYFTIPFEIIYCKRCKSKWTPDGRHTDGHTIDMRTE